MKGKIIILFLLFSLSFYGQNDTISVVRHTDNDLIFPKNKKILFRGIRNEIFIDVPNCKSFKVTAANGLKFISKNIYEFNPGAGLETTITIEIVLNNNKNKIEKHSFEIRNLKRPITCFNHINGDTIIRAQKSNFKNGVITVISPDKNLKLNFKVLDFNIKIPGQNSINIEGNKIDEKTFEKINRYASRFDEIAITDLHIKTFPSFSGCILINPILIKLY